MGRTGAKNLTDATHRPIPPTFTRGSSYDRPEGYADRSRQDRGCASIMACHSGSAAYIERMALASNTRVFGIGVSVPLSTGRRSSRLILMTKYLHVQ